MKIEVAAPGFGGVPFNKMRVEGDPDVRMETGARDAGTGRTYFLYRGRIVAVAVRE